MEAGAWRQRRRQARGGPRPSPEGQRHSHHHVQRPDVRRTRGTASATRGRGAPSRAASERARVRRPTWRRGVGRGSRSRYGRSVSRTLGAEILHPWENPVRPRTLAPLSPRLPMGSTTVNVLAGPTRLAAGPDARRGRPRREPVSRQPNSRILRSTRLNRVLTEIRIESDDCWDDVRRRPKREHFSRRNVGTFPESSTLPERERDCMQERHTRRLSRV